MKKTVSTLAFLSILTPALVASASEWSIDASHSNAAFSVRHLMVSNVKGDFTGVSGTIDFNEKSPLLSKVDVAIDVSTVDTRNAKRDAHLRNADFFNVEKFPKMTFRSKRIVKAGQDYKVIGDLTIRGVTRPVTLAAQISGPAKSPWGTEVVGISATTEIDRKDFGLTWNKVLETGGVAVGEKVKIELDVEINRPLGKRSS